MVLTSRRWRRSSSISISGRNAILCLFGRHDVLNCCQRPLEFSFAASILSKYIGSCEKEKGNAFQIVRYEW
jgi:hypothetical protein